MTSRRDVARAIAYFDQTDDIHLLHELTRSIAPRVKQMVRKLLRRSSEDSIPGPADLYPASEAASRDEAIRIVHETDDFALLQALARIIGQRIEAIEIAASADFPEGTRVRVPAEVVFPPVEDAAMVTGIVRSSGTRLTVQLDDGEKWEGPPSLAKKETQG